MAHLLKATRQDVLQEPAKEFLGADLHRFVDARTAPANSERHNPFAIRAGYHVDDSTVAYGGGQHGRQILLLGHSEFLESRPITLTNQFEVELKSVVSNVERTGLPLQIVFDVEDVPSEIDFGSGVWVAL